MRSYCQRKSISVRKFKHYLVEQGLAIFGRLEYCDSTKRYKDISGFFGITFRNTVTEVKDVSSVSNIVSLKGVKRTLIVPLHAKILAKELLPAFKPGVWSPPVDGIREDIMFTSNAMDVRETYPEEASVEKTDHYPYFSSTLTQQLVLPPKSDKKKE